MKRMNELTETKTSRTYWTPCMHQCVEMNFLRTHFYATQPVAVSLKSIRTKDNFSFNMIRWQNDCQHCGPVKKHTSFGRHNNSADSEQILSTLLRHHKNADVPGACVRLTLVLWGFSTKIKFLGNKVAVTFPLLTVSSLQLKATIKRKVHPGPAVEWWKFLQTKRKGGALHSDSSSSIAQCLQ